MTPRDEALNWRLVRLALPHIPNLREPAEFAVMLQRMEDQARLPVVFRLLDVNDAGAAVFEIGREGNTRIVTTRLRGVQVVWWLLANRGEPLPIADLTSPGAREPAASVRQAIKRTAADEFNRWGMPELYAAAVACSTQGEHVRMSLPINAPTYVTR